MIYNIALNPTDDITNNLLHILPHCITSRTKYSEKSWKSFGLTALTQNKLCNSFSNVSAHKSKSYPLGHLTWEVQCLHQTYDFYKISSGGANQPNQFPAQKTTMSEMIIVSEYRIKHIPTFNLSEQASRSRNSMNLNFGKSS